MAVRSNERPPAGAGILDVAVTIISHGHRDLLRECLEALNRGQAGIQVEAWVLDNGSPDGSADMVRTSFPDVHLLAEDRRRGFSANQNRLLQACRDRARHVLLLNDDAVIDREQLARLVASIDNDPCIAALAPELRYGDGSFQTAGEALPSWNYHLVRTLGLGRLIPARLRRAAGRQARRGPGAVYDTGYVAAACMLVRAQALAEIGPFDERFEMYSEDADWCRRAQLAGWRVCVDPSVKVIHHRRGSWSAFSAIERERSMFRYLRKSGAGTVPLTLLRAAVIARHMLGWLAGELRGRADIAAVHRAIIRLSLYE